ncbi:MAG: hypothetical protein AAF664_18040 [Planctomycetota bacterium]
MTWPCVDGTRVLKGAEHDLVRGALGMMTDALVDHYRRDEPIPEYGVPLFDCFEPDQQLWMLARVGSALLGKKSLAHINAIDEASVEAIFAEIMDLIVMEINDPEFAKCTRSWRQSVINAHQQQRGETNSMKVDSADRPRWWKLVAQVHAFIIPTPIYRRLERWLDGDPKQLDLVLSQRGLDRSFLDTLPPVQTVTQTQVAIDEIQSLVF